MPVLWRWLSALGSGNCCGSAADRPSTVVDRLNDRELHCPVLDLPVFSLGRLDDLLESVEWHATATI
jgi:hypothetical protein